MTRNGSWIEGVTFSRMDERSLKGVRTVGNGQDNERAAQPSRAGMRLGGVGRQASSLLIALWGLVVATLTLMPASNPGEPGDPLSRLCVICGSRGTADAILNLLFFAPLGVHLAVAGYRRPVLAGLASGAGLSLLIEITQVVVPGRYPTFGDVVWNGLGAGAGAWIWIRLADHVRTRNVFAARITSIVLGSLVGLAGWLLAPASTGADYFGQWTADLGHMPQYRGTLVSATLDGTAVPNARFSSSDVVRQQLDGDWTLEATVIKGTAPTAVAPAVSVYDANEDEILVIGIDDEDLVVRERTRASALRLDHPDLRLPSALEGVAVGDTLRLEARRLGQARCLSAEARQGCQAITPGRIWALLLYPEALPEGARQTLDAVWLAGVFLVVGLLSVSRGAVAANGLGLATLVALSVGLTRLASPPWWEILASAAGLVVGYATRALATRADSQT